jgi:integrase
MSRVSKVRVGHVPDGRHLYDIWFKGKRYRKITNLSRANTEKAGYNRLRELEKVTLGLGDEHPQKPVLFEAFAEDYIEKHAKVNNRPASVKRDRNSLKHLIPFFKNKYLHNITPELVEGYKANRKGHVSTTTVNREVTLLKSIMAKALEWKRISVNPIAGKAVKKFREENRVMRILTLEEARKLLAYSYGWLKAFIIIALCTGMRRNEILSLTREDIDFAANEIRVRAEISKSKRMRLVPMNAEVKKLLRSMVKGDRFIFFNEVTGRNLQDVKTAFRTAKKKAGIKGKLRVHDLRHTAASWMIEDGIDLVTVKEILGHASVQTTMIYCHPRKEIKHRAVALLGERIRPETVDVLVDTKGEARPENIGVTSSPAYS